MAVDGAGWLAGLAGAEAGVDAVGGGGGGGAGVAGGGGGGGGHA